MATQRRPFRDGDPNNEYAGVRHQTHYFNPRARRYEEEEEANPSRRTRTPFAFDPNTLRTFAVGVPVSEASTGSNNDEIGAHRVPTSYEPQYSNRNPNGNAAPVHRNANRRCLREEGRSPRNTDNRPQPRTRRNRPPTQRQVVRESPPVDTRILPAESAPSYEDEEDTRGYAIRLAARQMLEGMAAPQPPPPQQPYPSPPPPGGHYPTDEIRYTRNDIERAIDRRCCIIAVVLLLVISGTATALGVVLTRRSESSSSSSSLSNSNNNDTAPTPSPSHIAGPSTTQQSQPVLCSFCFGAQDSALTAIQLSRRSFQLFQENFTCVEFQDDQPHPVPANDTTCPVRQALAWKNCGCATLPNDVATIGACLICGEDAPTTATAECTEEQQYVNIVAAAMPSMCPTLRQEAMTVCVCPTETEKRLSRLRATLASVTADDSVFDDPSSYQSMALEWLAMEDPLQLDVSHTPNRTIQERYVVVLLYFATNGPWWSSRGIGFLTNTSVCDWHAPSGMTGILCLRTGREVTSIVLRKSTNTMTTCLSCLNPPLLVVAQRALGCVGRCLRRLGLSRI